MAIQATQRKKLRAGPRDDAARLDIVTPDDFIEVLEIEGEWRRVRSTDEAGNIHEGFIRASLLETKGPPEPTTEVINDVSFVMALTAAARDIGVNRDYLAALAWVESKIKNTVDDNTLATGPFQFTPDLWNELVGRFGVKFGIAHVDIIDPGMQATFAAKQTAIATEALGAQLGHPPNSIELYLSHRLTLPAALKVLSADSSQIIDSPIRDSLKDRGDAAALLNEVLTSNMELLKKGDVIKTKEEVLNTIEEKMIIGLQKAAEIVARLPADERSGRTSFTGDDQRIGELSAKFESRGPGDIGEDSTGGLSYGTYQIATKTGTMAKFLAFAQKQAPAFAQALEAAGGAVAAMDDEDPIFQNTWKDLARDPAFFDLQHDFIKSTHYDVQVSILQDFGLDVETRTFALKNVVWSVAVQHGGKTPLIKIALTGKQPNAMTDRAIIGSIYAERSKVEVYFKSSTEQVRKSVANRFIEEHANAVAMLA